jgi:hypothetical protein
MVAREKLARMKQLLYKASASLGDEDALEAIELFPKWDGNGVWVEKGERRRYEGILYRCEQSHYTQPDWTPDMVKALWTVVAEPGEIPVWVQPTGVQDSYMMYDKVYYPNKGDTIYISDVDNNVWSPLTYGWSVYHQA